MSDDNDWLTPQEAQAVLRRSERQIRNYVTSGSIRAQRRNRRVMYYRPDVEALATDMRVEEDPPRVEVSNIVPAVQLAAQVERLQAELRETTARAAYLEATLRQLPAPEEARSLQSELATARAQAEGLRAQLEQSKGAGRTWQALTIILAVAVLVAVAAVVFLAVMR